MNAQQAIDSMSETLGEYLPQALAAVVILLLGWIVALLIRAGVRRLLGSLRLNERLAETRAKSVDVQETVSRGVYYIVLLFVLIGVVNVLNLELVSDPLQALITPFFAFVPRLVAAGIVALTAWIVATLARTVIAKLLGATKLDERFPTAAGATPISDSLGTVSYWLVILLFLPAVLATLELGGLLNPVEDMIATILGTIPNLIGAIVIAGVGWFVARILRDVVRELLVSAGADKMGQRIGWKEDYKVSALVGLLVQIFVFIPALIAALEALRIAAISDPATGMLETLLSAVPGIVAAAAILAVAFILGRYVVSIAKGLLERLGFDELPAKLGFSQALPSEAQASEVAAKILYFFIVLFALIEAAHQVAFERLAELLGLFLEFGAQVLLGIVILAVGFWLANLAFEGLRRMGGRTDILAHVVRYTILGLVLAMGLRAMGIADDIVNLTFGLTLGSVAVAFALSFGLGGRTAAGEQLQHWFQRLREGVARRGEDSEPPAEQGGSSKP